MPPFRFRRAAIPRPTSGRPGATLGDLFSSTVARQPAAEMIVDGETRLSFADMRARVDTFSSRLQSFGVRPGDVVAYQLPNWWETVALFLATAELGAVSNPLLPIFRRSELLFTLRQSAARVVFVPSIWRGFDHAALLDELRGDLPALEHVVVCRAGDRAPTAAAAARTDLPRPQAEDLLLLMYTSGTTATPKGVLHTHDTLASEILSLARVHQLAPGDRCLMPSPLTHISGVIHAILTPAILGTAAVLMDRWDPAEALRRIHEERVTYMAGAPTFLQDLLTHAEGASVDLSSLRLFSCGGAAVSADLVRRARARIPGCVTKRVYGSTEFPTITTTNPNDALTHGIDTEGTAIAPAEVRIAREDGGEAPAGEEGEVQARGPECFVGYSDPALDDEAFTADGWYRTGDLGTLDAAGYLRITGRLKEIVVRKGEKISIREIEEILAQHPAVAEVAVVALPDPTTGECACAALVLRPQATLDLVEVGRFLSARGLARQKHPERLVLLASLPRTDSGKIAKAALLQALSPARS